jgi:hypothetical protein
MSLPWMGDGRRSNDVYQLHNRKVWPYEMEPCAYWSLMSAIKDAIACNRRYISKNRELIWENPYFERKSA